MRSSESWHGRSFRTVSSGSSKNFRGSLWQRNTSRLNPAADPWYVPAIAFQRLTPDAPPFYIEAPRNIALDEARQTGSLPVKSTGLRCEDGTGDRNHLRVRF